MCLKHTSYLHRLSRYSKYALPVELPQHIQGPFEEGLDGFALIEVTQNSISVQCAVWEERPPWPLWLADFVYRICVPPNREHWRQPRKKGGKQHVRLLTWASMLLFYIAAFVFFVLSQKIIHFFSRALFVISSNLEGNLLPAHSSKIFEPGN